MDDYQTKDALTDVAEELPEPSEEESEELESSETNEEELEDNQVVADDGTVVDLGNDTGENREQ